MARLFKDVLVSKYAVCFGNKCIWLQLHAAMAHNLHQLKTLLHVGMISTTLHIQQQLKSSQYLQLCRCT